MHSIDAAHCYWRSRGRSCNVQVYCKNGWTDRDAIWHVGGVGHGHQFWEISSPLKSIGTACSQVFIDRRMIRVVFWRKTQKLFGKLGVGFGIKRLQVRFPVGATLCNDCGQVDFFGDDAAFYRITSISCFHLPRKIPTQYWAILQRELMHIRTQKSHREFKLPTFCCDTCFTAGNASRTPWQFLLSNTQHHVLTSILVCHKI